MKTYLCIPRPKSNNASTTKNKLSPMTLLDRFREAVFRLIMISALTGKSNTNRESSLVQRSYYRGADPHQSEAVADCIEFIKKKSSPDQSRDSTASSSIDAISPVPVMCYE